jgi:hypothetical protein
MLFECFFSIDSVTIPLFWDKYKLNLSSVLECSVCLLHVHTHLISIEFFKVRLERFRVSDFSVFIPVPFHD